MEVTIGKASQVALPIGGPGGSGEHHRAEEYECKWREEELVEEMERGLPLMEFQSGGMRGECCSTGERNC